MNPWVALPRRSPYVLPEDRPAVEAFNRQASPRARLHLDLLPEPFIGRLDAPILLLTLNPGFAESDRRVHASVTFRSRVRHCHAQRAVRHPNYYLDPTVTGGGAAWWQRICAPLIREVGQHTVAANVGAIEYLAYHSERFAHASLHLPSQNYSFAAVRSAIDRSAIIFLARGATLWRKAIPELAAYPRSFTTRSVQNVVISPRNAPAGFTHALAALREAAV